MRIDQSLELVNELQTASWVNIGANNFRILLKMYNTSGGSIIVGETRLICTDGKNRSSGY